ncbi:MAG TPA: pyridoxamine 5'-phosphate oxidase family protein [Solirubrobacteraceae bacterium]|nr:pyridoxamine 5'-phosphate oxidase family protein [Solirubrobacteraceae bacterium]
MHAILDAGLVGHMAFIQEDQPYAIPMLYARRERVLYLHGSRLSRLLKGAGGGIPVCFTVTLVDGLVLARSGFHHSVNYRSVVVLGRAGIVEGEAAKRLALDTIVDHIVPGRTTEARGPSTKELAATEVLALELDEASAKLRTGGPVDAPEDYALPVWAGEIPLHLTAGEPVPDARCAVPLPAYLERLVAARA